jgi:F-type H+-transporting ATPase subunit delta
MVSVIASRYASALVEVVTAPGSKLEGAAASKQLRDVEAAVNLSSQLRGILQNPAISRSRKRAVIGRIAEAVEIAPQIKNFLFVAADRGRIGQLSEIREAFETLLDQRLGFARAEVTSAQALDSSQRERLEVQLTRISGKSVRPLYSVDPALVGGVVARIGSTVYDGSVRGQLETLRRKLTR